MGFRAAIYSQLTTDAGVTALVGTRVFPSVAPSDSALPRLVYTVIDADHRHDLGGGAGQVQRRVQIDVWDNSVTGVETLSEAVREALQGLQHQTVASVAIGTVQIRDEVGGYEPPAVGKGVGLHRNRMDFTVWHGETIPSH